MSEFVRCDFCQIAMDAAAGGVSLTDMEDDGGGHDFAYDACRKCYRAVAKTIKSYAKNGVPKPQRGRAR